MHLPRLSVFAVATTLLSSGWKTSAQDKTTTEDPLVSPGTNFGLSPDEASALVRKLLTIHEDFKKNKREVVASATSRITAGATNESAAVDLYLAAWKIVNLDRQGGEPGMSEKEALRRQIDWLKETGASKALQVQLAWLALTIEAAESQPEDRPRLLARARELAREAASTCLQIAADGAAEPEKKVVASVGSRNKGRSDAQTSRDGRRGPKEIENLLKASVLNSVFANAYNLQYYIKAPEDWSVAPLHFDFIYGQMLLPYYRQEKPTELKALWDEWIKYESALQRSSLDENAFLKWGQSQGKGMQWKMNMDLLHHGIEGRTAGDELIRLFTENPNHPRLSEWKKDLENLVSQITGDPL